MITLLLNSAKLASSDLIKNWKVILAIPLLVILTTIIAAISAPLGMIGGLIMGLSFIALLSIYFNWLKNSKHKHSLSWQELITFNQELFQRTLTVAFVLYIASMN